MAYANHSKMLGKLRAHNGLRPEHDRSEDGGTSSEIGTVTAAQLRDLTPDPSNRRAHNPRNVGLIADSFHAVGAARSIVIDEDGVVLAGNATIVAAADAGIENVRIIEASGHE